MARIRTIKPEFWSDERTGVLTVLEKCIFLGLISLADDEGLLKAHPDLIRSSLFPYDATIKTKHIQDVLSTLEQVKLICLYGRRDQRYLWVIRFRKHQRIDKPQPSKCPAPSLQNIEVQRAIFDRDGWVCHLCKREVVMLREKIDVYCGDGPDPGLVASPDHIIPLSKGGSDYPSNILTACISCNKGRGNKTPEEYCKNVLGTLYERSENVPRIVQDGREEEEEGEKERDKDGDISVVSPDTPPSNGSTNPKPVPTFRIDEMVLQNLRLIPRYRDVPRLKDPEWWRAKLIACPNVDFAHEMGKAAAWMDDRPRRKVKDLPQFLGNWFRRAQQDFEETHADAR